jgi:hypothetical protein
VEHDRRDISRKTASRWPLRNQITCLIRFSGMRVQCFPLPWWFKISTEERIFKKYAPALCFLCHNLPQLLPFRLFVWPRRFGSKHDRGCNRWRLWWPVPPLLRTGLSPVPWAGYQTITVTTPLPKRALQLALLVLHARVALRHRRCDDVRERRGPLPDFRSGLTSTSGDWPVSFDRKRPSGIQATRTFLAGRAARSRRDD